jgi:hypothetical protein
MLWEVSPETVDPQPISCYYFTLSVIGRLEAERHNSQFVKSTEIRSSKPPQALFRGSIPQDEKPRHWDCRDRRWIYTKGRIAL